MQNPVSEQTKKAPKTRKVPEIPVLLCILSLCIFFQYIEYFVVFSRFNHNIWVLRVLLYEPPRQKSRVNPKTLRIISRLFSSSMLGHPLNVLKIPRHTLLSLTNPHIPCYSQNRQSRQKSAKTVLQTLQQVRGGVVAHTHAWQVNILTTGSICEIQIWSRRDHRLAYLNQRDSCTVFYCAGGLFFMKHHPVQRKSVCIGFFYYGGTLYEQCILHVPGGTSAGCRNRPGARSQRITSSGVPAKIRSQHLRPHRHRIHAKKDLGRIDRTHASHAHLRAIITLQSTSPATLPAASTTFSNAPASLQPSSCR